MTRFPSSFLLLLLDGFADGSQQEIAKLLGILVLVGAEQFVVFFELCYELFGLNYAGFLFSGADLRRHGSKADCAMLLACYWQVLKIFGVSWLLFAR